MFKGKGTVVPVYAMKLYGGRTGKRLSILISALDGDGQ
jgi:hypothetical protein